MANTPAELHELVERWISARRASEAVNRSIVPKAVIIQIFYDGIGSGSVGYQQCIHTSVDVLREFIRHEVLL